VIQLSERATLSLRGFPETSRAIADGDRLPYYSQSFYFPPCTFFSLLAGFEILLVRLPTIQAALPTNLPRLLASFIVFFEVATPFFANRNSLTPFLV